MGTSNFANGVLGSLILVNNIPYIAFYNQGADASGYNSVKRFNEGAWQYVGNSQISSPNGRICKLAYAVNTIYLACSEGNNSGINNLTVKKLEVESGNGKSLHFDGIDDYIQMSSTGFPFHESSRTVEAWVKTSAAKPMVIFSYGVNPGYNAPNLFMMIGKDGKVDWLTGSGGSDLGTAPTAVNDGKWHHIAFTYDNSTNLMSIYVDGKLDATKKPGGKTTPGLHTGPGAGLATIGCSVPNNRGATTWYFDGQIDEVRVWNIAKSEQQINDDKNSKLNGTEAGLVAYYNFNQDAGSSSTVVKDIKGTNDGTLKNFQMNGSTSDFSTDAPPVN